jgi:predicted peroxiredoxin
MRNYIVTLLFACLLAVPAFGSGSENSKNLFVVVTTDDPVTQLMSMVLATQTMTKGATVDVLLCGQAGALAVSDSPEILLKPNDKSPQMLLKNLIENGVTVELCPPYLPNNGKTPADLIDGVSVAKPPLVADKLLHEDTRILSY